MATITRILVAAVRANPTLALGVALELAYLAARAIRKSKPRGGIHDAARAIEVSLQPPPRPATRGKRRKSARRAAARRARSAPPQRKS